MSASIVTVPPEVADRIHLAQHAISWNIPRGNDFPIWLDDVRDAGYEGVAIFGMQLADYIDDPAVLRGMLDERGLQLAAVTGLLNDAEDWVDRMIGFMAEFGTRHLAFTDFNTTLTIPGAIEMLNRRAEVGDEFGVNVYYHNHTGGVGETRTQVDQILAGLDPMHRHVMLDVGHATKDFAELPPTERATSFLERYWGEIEYLEFKDWNETTDLNTPLGEGYADYERILSLVADGNFSGWIVVEQNGNEGLSLGRGPAECGRVSRQFLRQHGL